jgi:hypothetical protein
MHIRSSDNGTSWTSPSTLNLTLPDGFVVRRNSKATPHTDNAGNWILAWGTNVKFLEDNPTYVNSIPLIALSTDAGATWRGQALRSDHWQTFWGQKGHGPGTNRIQYDFEGNWLAMGQYFYNENLNFRRWQLPPRNPDSLYVDFESLFNGTGTDTDPFNVLADALDVANEGAIINLRPGQSGESISGPQNAIDKAVTLRKHGTGGPVRIGVP